jgi:uncharacterized protein YbjT (DUF2867 family)
VDVVVLGGHGKVALRLLRLLAERGDRARGIIRNPDHASDLEEVGAEPVIGDVEELDDISELVAGADAAVMAAGAGPGSGPARKRTVDYGGALKLIHACHRQRVRRYLMVSAMGVRDPRARGEEMTPYYQAKLEADHALASSGLDYTIVRPGGLTDDPGTGRVRVGTNIEYGYVPRDDVAAVLLAVLEEPSSIGKTFELVSGDTPIEEAVRSL